VGASRYSRISSRVSGPRRWADRPGRGTSAREPSTEAVKAHAAAVEALERAVELCRPGTSTSEIDAAARAIIDGAGGSYPHHTGHGLGVTFHEEPRVVPSAARVLAEGMVVALEPGLYGEGFGVRAERVVLVTAQEPEVLSGHDLSL
jgi:Xaa-Pro aminopeptidase